MTLEVELLEIARNPNDDGTRLNEITDEFREGRDVRQILPVLDSRSPEVVSSGVWILNELHFELYSTDEFVSRLHALLEHSDPVVRFYALGSLFPSFDPTHAPTRELLAKLRDDPSSGVRERAAAAAARLEIDATNKD